MPVGWRGSRTLGATYTPADRQLARARVGKFIRVDILWRPRRENSRTA